MLLADDSAAVQKVIELTFSDEGMKVVSVGDGRSALEKLEQFTPDVVLADAFMPGLNGYELCRSIKDDQRFSQIPVMLLVSSFAPFDEAEAQRAGADDIMTKPFQSIRQLVTRVGSLLSPDKPAAQVAVPQSPPPAKPVKAEPNVKVLVEAAPLETAESQASGSACAPDIDFQTADTAHLEPAISSPEANAFESPADFEDTIEVEPQYEHAMNAGPSHFTPVAATVEYTHPTSMNETVNTPEPSRPTFNDALLDLDESDYAAAAVTDDDVILDLDDESPAVSQSSSWQPQEKPVIEPPVAVAADSEMAAPEPVVAEAEPEVVAPGIPSGDWSSAPSQLSSDQLSPEVIDAIARRVVEHLSDRVVREIAWEVVPELSELMIRKKLDEQK